MKLLKSFFLFVCLLFCAACDQDVLTDLQSQINALKSNQIASIEAQVSNINASLTALEATDTELKGYIATLQEQQAALAQENSNLAEIIATTKKDLQDSIGTVQADLLAQLEAYKQTVSGQLALIDASIATLTAKDTELEAQIAALREYTDSEIQKAKDWASATFVTLEKYNETVALVTTIQQQITAINTRMDTFQNDLTTLSTQLAGLREDHLKAIQDNAAALATAVTNITNAYTEAIATAITTSETSLKNWVAAELTAYYTAAQTDAKLAALQAEQDQKLSQQKTYVENLLTNLQTVLEGKISANTELINGLQGQINNLSAEAAQLAKSILDNADSIAVNSTKIKENAQAISQNSADITTCGSLIAANKTLIQDNGRAIAANDTAILALQALVATNEQGISNNVINIAKNAADIAVNAGLIAANATAISNNTTAIADNAAAITQLQTDLQAAIADLTESYNSAIQTAITTLDGKLTGEIASQISTVNTRIDTEVAAINSAITALTARVEACESDIAAIRSDIAAIRADIEALQTTVASLLARIQSISYVPKYSDAKAVMTFTNNGSLAPGFAELTFKIQPASAATTLAEVWQTALKVESVLAETRTAPETVNLPIQSVSAVRGYLTVFVGGAGLSENFFTGTKSAFVALVVSDGNNTRASEYVNLIPEVAITTAEASDITPISALIKGFLGKETANRITEKALLYYSTTESSINSLIEEGQRIEITPSASGSFSVNLQSLETNATYHYIAAVNDCGEWFYGPLGSFTTIDYTVEIVDLDLPSGLRWASYNLGATTPEGAGVYFAWGETSPKNNYTWETYLWCNGSASSLTKYSTVDGITELEPEDDAATVKLGGLWRIPTQKEAQYLLSCCSWKDTTINGVTGELFIRNGVRLFFPRQLGYYSGKKKYTTGVNSSNGGCNYWCKEVDTSNNTTARQFWNAYTLSRCYGLQIRPVLDVDWSKTHVTITTDQAVEIGVTSATLVGSYNVESDRAPHITTAFLISDDEESLLSGMPIRPSRQEDGSFSAQTTDLKHNTTYYYVARVEVFEKAFYGEVKTFTTKDYQYTAEAVDMGLPSGLKWASYNLGASSPEETGAYFAWGETEPKKEFSWLTYKWCNGSEETLTKYCTEDQFGLVDGKEVIEIEDDAAAVKLGGTWRMPTYDEYTELENNCDVELVVLEGVPQYRKYTSLTTGNVLVIPVTPPNGETLTGRYLMDLPYQGVLCWTASLIPSDHPYYSKSVFAHATGGHAFERYTGLNIRPVLDRDWGQIEVALSTLSETELRQHSARLNGHLDVIGETSISKKVWFILEKGPVSLEELKASNKTIDVALQQDGSFSFNTASDQYKRLQAGTEYCYVACAKVGTRTFYGEVKSFTTEPYSFSAEPVDMGLPSGLKWASYNLGASSPEGTGAYFAWGETAPKNTYTWQTYRLCNGSETTLTKYCISEERGTVDNKIELEEIDDAAVQILGETWRIPTADDWSELQNPVYCTWTWGSENGINGYRVTSNITGQSLFLPAAGENRGSDQQDSIGSSGYYWSSEIYSTSRSAKSASFSSSSIRVGNAYRCYGCTIRPVLDIDWSQISVTVTSQPVEALGCHSVRFCGLLDVISELPLKKIVWFLYGENLSDLNALIISGKKIDTAPQLDGSFLVDLSSNYGEPLKAGTTYYYVACAKVGTRTFYGEVTSFTTKEYTYTVEPVDMGLSVKWSSVNLGALNPETDGAYFAWGETITKPRYDWSTYSLCGGTDVTMYKYCTNSNYGTADGKTTLELVDDVAHVKLGGTWRIPTDAEWSELRNTDNCIWTWTKRNGVNGFLVTSKITDNSIFLPAVGRRVSENLHLVSTNGVYWSSSLDPDGYSYDARCVSFNSGDDPCRTYHYRYEGLSIRPVCDN